MTGNPLSMRRLRITALLLSSATALLGTSSLLAADTSTGITLTLDTDTLFLGDSVTLDVETTGLIEPVDASSLFRNAELLRETVGTRIAVHKGKVVEVKLRHMELLPAREGIMIFGPLSGEAANGTVTSNSVALKVGPPVDRDWTPTDQDLELAVNISRSTAMVGEMIIAEVVLRHRHAIADERIELPGWHGFDVLKVYDTRRTLDPPDDGEVSGWRRIAWRYLLWPRHSGTIALDALRWSGTMIRSRSQRGNFERETVPMTLEVLPASTKIGEWWLAAGSVSLQSDWSDDPRSLSAGDQIIRTITLTATDVLSSSLPDVVPLESRAISSVPIDVQRSQKLIGDELTSTVKSRFRLTAQSPIPVFLDTVRVGWWDTKSRESRESIIPARRINVGLPDREDLLADLAVTGRWWERAWLNLQSLPLKQPLMWTSFVFLCLLLVTLLVAPAVAAYRVRQTPASRSATSALPQL